MNNVHPMCSYELSLNTRKDDFFYQETSKYICICQLVSKQVVYVENISSWRTGTRLPGGRFKNHYELLNLRALKISPLYQNHFFQCMGKIFCVEFQRYPLKFHTKYLTHTLKDVDFIHRWKLRALGLFSSKVFLKRPPTESTLWLLESCQHRGTGPLVTLIHVLT